MFIFLRAIMIYGKLYDCRTKVLYDIIQTRFSLPKIHSTHQILIKYCTWTLWTMTYERELFFQTHLLNSRYFIIYTMYIKIKHEYDEITCNLFLFARFNRKHYSYCIIQISNRIIVTDLGGRRGICHGAPLLSGAKL